MPSGKVRVPKLKVATRATLGSLPGAGLVPGTQIRSPSPSVAPVEYSQMSASGVRSGLNPPARVTFTKPLLVMPSPSMPVSTARAMLGVGTVVDATCTAVVGALGIILSGP